MLTTLLRCPSRRSMAGLVATLAAAATLVACDGDPAAPDATVTSNADAAVDAEPADAAVDASPDAEPLDCDAPIACPPASPNKVTVCGQLFDLGSDAPIRAAEPTGEACGDPTETGPCSVAVTFYDAIAFVNDPNGAQPLPVDNLIVDDCGRFSAHDIARPDLGQLGITVDDPANVDANVVARTAGLMAVDSAQVVTDHQAYVLTQATASAWLASSQLEGASFEARGAYVPIFRLAGVPRPGVTITRGVNPDPDDDYYFSDAEPAARTTIAPAQAVTGANGTGLMLNSTLGQHSATGGDLPEGCAWPATLAATIQGVIFVGVRDAEDPKTGELCE